MLMNFCETSWGCLKQFSARSSDLSVEWLGCSAAVLALSCVCFMTIPQMDCKAARTIDTDVQE